MERLQHHIGGREVAPAGRTYLPSSDPSTGLPWIEIADGDRSDVDRAVEAAADASFHWRSTPPATRAELLWAVADRIAGHADELAGLETRENGKVLREMRGQMTRLPRWYRYFGGVAQGLSGRTIPLDSVSTLNYTLREPYGVVGVIPPFNSPVLLTSFAVAPALAAGNTVVVKPSEHASAAVLRLAELFADAGVPDGTVNVVTGTGAVAGDALVAHEGVDKVVFTGGPETARRVAARAAERLAPTVLELGGKSANIVCADAHLAAAANGVLAGIFAAAGQTCVAGSRLLVHTSVADDLVALIADRARRIVVGPPLAPDTEMGPMARPELRDRARERVDAAVAAGGTLVATGSSGPAGSDGWYQSPIVLEPVDRDQPVVRDELFAPVLSVLRFHDDAEAVEIANDSPYGLAAGLWTRDLSRAHRLASALDAGTVWVNTYRSVSYASPFGGRKRSGYGVENGLEGLLEFTRSKSVWIETADDAIGDPFVLR